MEVNAWDLMAGNSERIIAEEMEMLARSEHLMLILNQDFREALVVKVLDRMGSSWADSMALHFAGLSNWRASACAMFEEIKPGIAGHFHELQAEFSLGAEHLQRVVAGGFERRLAEMA